MSIRKRVEAAIQRGLYPVVRLLLEYGVTESHFAQIARSVFVKVAAESIENNPLNPGSKATAARIAVMTGVPRNAIKPILDSSTVIGQDEWYRHLCAGTLSAWHSTTEYLDKSGRPIAIPFSGPAPSFESLAEAEGQRGRSSVSPHAILDELKLVGAVEEVPADPENPENGETLLVAREKIFRRVGSKIEDLEAAMDHIYNMITSKREVMINNSKQVLAEDIVTLKADKAHSKILLRDLRAAALSLLDSAENTMDLNSAKDVDGSDTGRRVGIGVYVYADDDMTESPYFQTTIAEDEDQQLVNE